MINIDKEKVDSLIFDMDGTLWDAMKSYAEVWNVAFRELGLAITVDESVLKQAILTSTIFPVFSIVNLPPLCPAV